MYVHRAIGLLFPMIAGLSSGVAFAGDGVLEINQTCAVQTGCFAGDGAGFPVTINGTAGRSYLLTSDLVVPNENTDGIVVDASDIGIDLNNFAIIAAACVGATTNCTPTSGTGSGIERSSTAIQGTSVRDGSIIGMGNFGVLVGNQSEVRSVRARWNRVVGISAGSGSTISGNIASESGGAGLTGGAGVVVSGNTAYGNGGRGIGVAVGATVVNNTVHSNASDGIFVNSGSTVSGNTAYLNGGDGIEAFGSASTVSGNTARSNTGFGLELGSQSGYRENVISNNTAGTVNGALAVNLGNNACNGSATCP